MAKNKKTIVASLTDLLGIKTKQVTLTSTGQTVCIRRFNGHGRSYLVGIITSQDKKNPRVDVDALLVALGSCDVDGEPLLDYTDDDAVNALAENMDGLCIAELSELIAIYNGFQTEAIDSEKKPSEDTPNQPPGSA